MNNIKLIALDIDGVALPDTFSPIIYLLVQKWNGTYTAEIEKNVFSQRRNDAASYLKIKFNLSLSNEEILDLYFNQRSNYLKEHPIRPVSGLHEFLEMARQSGLKVISYGGLDKSHFDKELAEFTGYFDEPGYICTNDFRPGIKEIVCDIYSLDYKNVLFIDDVNRVAMEAKKLNVPFIGVPSDFQYGFQRTEMIQTGVKYMVSSISEISQKMIEEIDIKAGKGLIWN